MMYILVNEGIEKFTDQNDLIEKVLWVVLTLQLSSYFSCSLRLVFFNSG